MHELQKKHHESRMARYKELYERQIKMVDAQIDRLVYDLYVLTEEAVKVVESGDGRYLYKNRGGCKLGQNLNMPQIQNRSRGTSK